jgi:hypothetical protein
MSDVEGQSESLIPEDAVTLKIITWLALGSGALELVGAVVDYVASNKVDGALLGLSALSGVVGGVSAWVGRIESNMHQLRAQSHERLDLAEEQFHQELDQLRQGS